MPNNPFAALAALAPLLGAMAPAAPAPAQAPAAPAAPEAKRTSFQEVTVRGVVRAYKHTTGFNKGKWSMSVGDLEGLWSSKFIESKDLEWVTNPTTGKKSRVSRTYWEVTFGIGNSGRVWVTNAVDTGEPAGVNETLDEDAEPKEDSLDEEAPAESTTSDTL